MLRVSMLSEKRGLAESNGDSSGYDWILRASFCD